MQETGCDGVKLEGGEEMAETIAFLVARGIPVFGHVGLMPQLVHTAGGFRSLGHSDAETQKSGAMRLRWIRQAPSPSSWKAPSSRSPAN